ncbi:metal-dependent transcriptional regulator [Kribbella pratensis]|uniref:metal-dependent transcriptional regulator n=1 Tax=Kribbella sp. NPDC049584 TaxID=3154833 RepID=UPI001EDCDEE8|nr:metal-dependent transcriptional regulator [Kribbella pratensis]
MSELIDTTEMYLRTVYELEEEGILPLRARIAERLHQSGPTVSQTVARMERDGLIKVEGDRHLELTDVGRKQAVRVMRKHRLAERLLVDVIGLEWEDVHAEACRWEHVMSDAVELRLLKILDNPTESPYGNPIPGLEELQTSGIASGIEDFRIGVEPLDQVLDQSTGESVRVLVRRIAEPVQTDDDAMAVLRKAGALPGREVDSTMDTDGVLVGSREAGGVISDETAGHIFVSRV